MKRYALIGALLLAACGANLSPAPVADCDAGRPPADVAPVEAAVAVDAPAAAPFDEASLLLGPPRVTTSSMMVPINAQTVVGGDAFDGLELHWDALGRATDLAIHDPPQWGNPPRSDGNTCDEACVRGLYARAAAHGGELPATVTRTLVVRRAQYGGGDAVRCVLEMGEQVAVDLGDAVRGVAPELEGYDFLRFSSWSLVTIAPTPCP